VNIFINHYMIFNSFDQASAYFNLQFILKLAAVSILLYKVIKYLYTKIKSGYLSIKKQYDELCKIHSMIPKIYSELTPNHGTSIKDKVDKIKEKVDENTKVTKQICLRQRWILDNREEPIFECDAEGKCTWVNEKYCQLTKFSPSNLLENGWKNVIHEDDREHVLDEWESALKDKRSSTCSFRIVDHDGVVYHVTSIATVTEDMGYIGSIRVLSKE